MNNTTRKGRNKRPIRTSVSCLETRGTRGGSSGLPPCSSSAARRSAHTSSSPHKCAPSLYHLANHFLDNYIWRHAIVHEHSSKSYCSDEWCAANRCVRRAFFSERRDARGRADLHRTHKTQMEWGGLRAVRSNHTQVGRSGVCGQWVRRRPALETNPSGEPLGRWHS